MEAELPYPYMFANAGLFFENGIHALCLGHSLTPLVADEDILLQNLAHVQDIRAGIRPVEGLPFRDEGLAARRADEIVRIKVAERLSDDTVKTVVNGQENDEGGRSDGHAYDAYRRDDVYDIVGLPGEKVTAGYEERQVHYILSNCSMCSA